MGRTSGQLMANSILNWQKLWLQRGFPRSYLHGIGEESMNWRRDLSLLAETHLTNEQRRRLIQIIAHKHGQYWNHLEAVVIIGVSYKLSGFDLRLD
jgi:hypothetical protein